MKRLHVHVAVEDLETAIGFYSALFSAPPSIVEADYAKWSLEDPRANFAISARGRAAGVDHLGIEVETDEALAEIENRLTRSGITARGEREANCCYAVSDKAWTVDPAGVRWEAFHTLRPAPSRAAEAKTVCCPTCA
ncbi:MAG: ArsI/CadI family heavy metal resistance metalloenzyme [Caulobacteraceae bacterium]